MAAKITQLINRPDYFEIIRDQLPAILVVESAAQEALAELEDEDPALWRLKVFRERLNPWSDFLESPGDATPIVSVSYDNSSFDQSKSNAVERQHATSTFFIDCFGYGIASDETAGHQPGDEEAAINAHRAVRLVRNILMAGPYTYLGLQGVVGFRWPDSIQIQHPQSDGRFVQNIVGARIALQVRHNEFSPQAQGQPLELISAQVKRSETGQLLLSANYP